MRSCSPTAIAAILLVATLLAPSTVASATDTECVRVSGALYSESSRPIANLNGDQIIIGMKVAAGDGATVLIVITPSECGSQSAGGVAQGMLTQTMGPTAILP